VHERRGKPDQAAVAVDGGRPHGCDLMLTEAFADQVEAGGERRQGKGCEKKAVDPVFS
jgi:hypothetical protein